MSKIFDALQRGGRSETADLLPQLFGNQGTADAIAKADAAAATEAPDHQTPEPRALTSEAVGFARRMPLVVTTPAILPFEDPSALAAEQYRVARTKITHDPRHPTLIVIASPNAGDGKTITAVNLAGVMALKGDNRILLIDADFRRSSMADLLGVPKGPGLADVLSGKCTLDEAVIQPEQMPNLHILVNGELEHDNPTELLDSARWRELCELMRSRYHFVIADSPPVAAVADFELIQMAVDGVILVVRPEHTNRAGCMKALEKVPKNKFLGVLINCAKPWIFDRSDHYGYDYRYYATPNGAGSAAKPNETAE